MIQKTEQTAETAVKRAAEAANQLAKGPEAKDKDNLPIESLIKHPLQNSWTLWYYDNEKGKTWEECQHQITSFETVEDFWSIYNHIKTPSELKIGNDYSLFKNNIRPMWEDDQNKNGGRWLLTLRYQNASQQLDGLWLDVILCLIGEAFDYSEDICGAVVNVRSRGHRIGKSFQIVKFVFCFLLSKRNISVELKTDVHHIVVCSSLFLFSAVWTSNSNKERILGVGKKLKEVFKVQHRLAYEYHRESATNKHSHAAFEL